MKWAFIAIDAYMKCWYSFSRCKTRYI